MREIDAIIRLCALLQEAFVGSGFNSVEWIRWGEQLEKIKAELRKGGP